MAETIQTSIRNSSRTLSDLIPESIWSFHCIIIQGLISVIPEWSSDFPYFLQFKSEFGNKEFMIWATSQLPVLLLLTVQSFSIFGCKEYNQSYFSTDYLVMPMCRVFSCVVGRGCLLWSVRSLSKTLLAFALLCFVFQGQICLLLQAFLHFLLLHSSPL